MLHTLRRVAESAASFDETNESVRAELAVTAEAIRRDFSRVEIRLHNTLNKVEEAADAHARAAREVRWAALMVGLAGLAIATYYAGKTWDR